MKPSAFLYSASLFPQFRLSIGISADEKKGLLNIESSWSEFGKQLLKWYIRDSIQPLH